MYYADCLTQGPLYEENQWHQRPKQLIVTDTSLILLRNVQAALLPQAILLNLVIVVCSAHYNTLGKFHIK